MIPVRGRVPQGWSDATAAHLTERLQAIERELSGSRPVYSTPAKPTFGSGSGAVPPSGSGGTTGGGGGGGGVTDHGALTGLLDDDHPLYMLRGEEPETSPHIHVAADIADLPAQDVSMVPHVHSASDIIGAAQEAPGSDQHAHRLAEVSDFNLWEMMLWREVYGG